MSEDASPDNESWPPRHPIRRSTDSMFKTPGNAGTYTYNSTYYSGIILTSCLPTLAETTKARRRSAISRPNKADVESAHSARTSSPMRGKHRTEATDTQSPLEIFPGNHLNTKDESDLPFKSEGPLGHGGSAIVDKVVHMPSGALYARKIFGLNTGKDLEALEVQLLNEWHSHIVRSVASYFLQTENKTELALIMQPVADMSLWDFLQHVRESGRQMSTADVTMLMNSFGCLTSALAFTHEWIIRHKDIKPSNILVHNGKVLLAGFGLAVDYSDLDSTTTRDEPGAFTVRYSAPEIITESYTSRGKSQRNRKTDVFSLGCTFIEILATLSETSVPVDPWKKLEKGIVIELLDSQGPSPASPRTLTRYAEGADQIVDNISHMMETRDVPLNIPDVVYHALRKMLRTDIDQRCDAKSALAILRPEESLFCGDCKKSN